MTVATAIGSIRIRLRVIGKGDVRETHADTWLASGLPDDH
jgi:hypothetical protein